jgi:hypothetical protein
MDGLLDWYLLGVALGLGVAAGAGRLGGRAARALAVAALVGGLVIAFFAGSAVWAGPFAGLALGVLFLRHLSREASLAATLGLGALALVPALGYVESLGAPLLGRRLTRRAESRYAGLRVLAKD